MTTLNNLIETTMQEADGVGDDAVEALRKKLRGNKRLFDEVVWPIILISLRYQVRRHDGLIRKEFWTAMELDGDGAGGDGRIEMSESKRLALTEEAIAVIGSIYHYPLSNGKKLGNATRVDLSIEIDLHNQLSVSNGIRAKWFEMVCDRLPNDKMTVRKGVGEAEIVKMAQEAEASFARASARMKSISKSPKKHKAKMHRPEATV